MGGRARDGFAPRRRRAERRQSADGGDAAAREPARPSRGYRARCFSASARPRRSASAAPCCSRSSRSIRPTGSELYNTNNRNTPDGLANLPRDYTGLPKPAPQLGPPLPGDLGKPILNAGAPAPGMPRAAGPSPEEQRIAQEQEAARVSHLFATDQCRRHNSPRHQPSPTAGVASAATTNGSTDLTSQDHKLAFLNGNIDRRTTSPDRVQPPASQYHPAGGRRDPGIVDHRTALRSAWTGHRAGDRRRL